MGRTFAWVSWDKIEKPKNLGGWGLKNLQSFVKALATKMGWQIIKLESIWQEVIYYKYIHSLSIMEWIRCPNMPSVGASNIWKAFTQSFNTIKQGLAWKIGKGEQVCLGTDA